MPRRSETSDTDHGGRRNPRRGNAKVAVYNDNDDDLMDGVVVANNGGDNADGEKKNATAASSSDTDESLEEKEEEEEDVPPHSRRAATSSKEKATTGKAKATKDDTAGVRRTSSRSTKFASSLAEPSGDSIRDLLNGDSEYIKATTTVKSRKGSRANSRDSTDSAELSEDVDVETTTTPSKKRKVLSKKGVVRDSLGAIGNSSPCKSPARRHSMVRNSLRQEVESDSSEECSEEESDEGEDEGDEIRIQRILASRTEKRSKWREICQAINTSEIDTGSRWFQGGSDKDDPSTDDTFEERFLVKWSDLSYMHSSWETRDDLIDQVEGAKIYLSTFFRKSENGILFSADERCDGDYFDPAYTQIDRILEVQFPADKDHPAFTAEDEDRYTSSDFGILMDKSNPEYEDGTGRQFLIKWCHTPYSVCTYEFERDMILNDIDYKDDVKSFLRRNKKPSKSDMRTRIRKGEEELRRSYKFFGDKSTISDEKRDECVQKYQKELEETVFPNGGQLRDYQAEGVSWMLSNLVNSRSSILADEMGLGKTLQTCATVNLIANRLNRPGPALIVAPLSTLSHWQREFNSWTGLNAIVYHGSADDRRLIRMLEMAYECDRPQDGVGINQLYLKKCGPKKFAKTETPWMAQVVITTPEMLVADDFKELTAIHWEILVVDEAHRLKNHNSKLAVNLRDDKFSFGHKLLLTGTPIQNDVQEFWTLLNFINPDDFDDADAFLEKYGDIKSKERIDELHEEIRTYILRRLKEDVEKSVPPKEETLIEVELTVAQKQYYRALYEKNVKFLHKNNKRALDGPSLNNLAMQLRKCCNHLFLLNGVEEEFRRKETNSISEADFLVKASGKLVLLDKLLPRLKQEGHRVLVFSQFKIMLDILEDYFNCRSMKFERIDGSITGHRRQQAIDRFQAASTEDREAPFVMMLSTRAGGVGINLTAADTCIIFDSDWNPQNDLQAQARCHRIGQTKSVNVYRLLTRKTYEMQMFHMSSLKMGLDQAVLNGFESGSSGEGSLSKEEIEKLLRHGAYDIFNEEAAGTAEAESNDFVHQDIDSILLGRSRTVVHDNTGSKSNAAGGTFSKARFKAAKTPDTAKGKGKHEDIDIDIEDPDFWKKMVGESSIEEEVDDSLSKRRHRTETNYSEREYMKQLETTLKLSDAENNSDSDSYADEEGDETSERCRWGGSSSSEWKKEHVESLIASLLLFGYSVDWDQSLKRLEFGSEVDSVKAKRMSWSLALLSILETADDDAIQAKKREERAAEKKQEESGEVSAGVLAMDLSQNCIDEAQLKEKHFEKLWNMNATWAKLALEDAVTFAKANEPRDSDTLKTALLISEPQKPQQGGVSSTFAENVWPSLKSRGWKAVLSTEGPSAGKTRYTYVGKQYSSLKSVLSAVPEIHPELSLMAETLMKTVESSRREEVESQERIRAKHLSLTFDTVNMKALITFLNQYAPLQLLVDRTRSTRIRLSRRLLSTCSFMHTASALVRKAQTSSVDTEVIGRLASSLVVDKRTTLPHPLWTTKHDAVLVLAIAKHGWIDQEASCRAITNDPTVAWGPPFEVSDENENSAAAVQSRRTISDLRATGSRAASIMNEHHDLLEETKGFNTNLVVRAYDLLRHAANTTSHDLESSNVHSWIVHDTAVDDSGESSPREHEPVELPTKKDLVRRAKIVLARSNGPAGETNAPVATRNSFGFAVLDQSETCNILLAEMMRGILKAPSISKSCRNLCQLALKEAQIRLHTIQTAGSAGSDVASKPSKEGDDMIRITRQIEIVQRNLKKSARGCKNLVRVMLGADPHQPRNANEIMFPVEKTAPSALEIIRVTNTSTKTSGEKAFEQATKRAHTRNSETDAETLIDLTDIETLILQIICSQGLPVWRDAWKRISLGASDGSSADSAVQGAKYTTTWLSVGHSLTTLAQSCVKKAAEKARKARKEYERLTESDNEKSEGNAMEAERVFVVRETAAEQAIEYAADPETLAKKTIMMLEKLRRHMVPVSLTQNAVRSSDNGLGVKIVLWLAKEIERWSISLNLVDDKNCPLAYSAVDFLEDLSDEERSGVEIATSFDKKGCRNVLSQVASVSRIRSVYVEYKYVDFLAKMEKATKNLVASGDVWEQKPEWWGPPSQPQGSTGHDSLLLERLLNSGFDSVLESNENSSHSGQTFSCSPFKEVQLNKGALQLRVNQLARELHAMEEASNSFRILEERRNLNGSAHEPAAKKPAASRKSSKNGGTQTGLLAFFGPGNPTSQPEVITIDDDSDAKADDEVEAKAKRSDMSSEVEVVPQAQGKRKDDGNTEEGGVLPSPEKKHRVS